MNRIVYVNGAYVAETDAKISVFDRGFLMADAVYEVVTVIGSRLIDFPAHMARLARSMNELAMTAPAGPDELLGIHRELISRNGLDEGAIYLQVTRGAADRDFAYPAAGTPPSLVLFTQAKPVIESAAARRGISVVCVPDLRWGRRDIKTVQLLYPSMAKMDAKARGADDAWFVEPDGRVTEGTSNNAYIVTADRRIVTRRLSHSILHGITRASVVALAAEDGFTVDESGFTLEEAKDAREAFITSASAFVTPVVSIDGVSIGDGAPGPAARRLRDIYITESLRNAI